MKDSKKQNIITQISSCLMKKYNGFQVISIEFTKKERKISNQLILSTNPENIQILNHFVILKTIFQKLTLTFIQLKIKLNVRAAAINAIIVENFL